MGKLNQGKWIYEELLPPSTDGEFKRQDQKFRDTISSPELDRYHLYVSYACPWAHRSLIMRKLKGLEEIFPVSVVSPYMLDDGWTFIKNFEGVVPDSVFGKTFLRDIYTEADPQFTGKVTVPVLFDKKTNTIINNESAEIIRIFNTLGEGPDYYPKKLRSEIDEVNEDIYHKVNNGVYKTGFARTQEAYEKNFLKLFDCLDRIEKRLENSDFLVGNTLTEADIRLYTTLVRFDPVYYVHFKCNRRLIREFKNLSAYLARLYALPAFQETTHFDHIKAHYYFSHDQINPFRIVPLGPSMA